MKLENRNIEVLDDFEHVKSRPNMYIGSVEPSENKTYLYSNTNQSFYEDNLTYSIGLYRLYDEIFDNAIDEAKRCKREGFKCEKIVVKLNTSNNSIKIRDYGRGFIGGDKINLKTGVSNVESAITFLRSGSNFSENDSTVIGTNGIGLTVTNMLSEYFGLCTRVSKDSILQKCFNKFIGTEDVITKDEEFKGTEIEFIPRKDIFSNNVFDQKIIFSNILLRLLEIKNSDDIDCEIEFYLNDNNIPLKNIKLVPENSVKLELSKKGLQCFIWPKRENEKTISLSFVNSSRCIGIHQSYVSDFINEKIFQSNLASNYYSYILFVKLPAKYVKFQEQNKNRFISSREELSKRLPLRISSEKFEEIMKNETICKIIELIKENEINQTTKKIKLSTKEKIIHFSDKFIPGSIKDRIILCEGLSAAGSISQKRNSKTDSIYALRGKIKNVQNVNEILTSKLLVELIGILGLDLKDKGETCSYNQIILACDADPDGSHIIGLFLNFFNNFFPRLFTNNKVFILKTPLVRYQDINKKIKYEYSLPTEEKIKNNNIKNVKYFKGLGSLNIEDWEYIFKDLYLSSVQKDDNSSKFLNIFFGDNVKYRKKWLLK